MTAAAAGVVRAQLRPATALPGGSSGAALLTVTMKPISSGAVVISVHGEVDRCTSPLLQDAVLAQLRPGGPSLVIDLTEVDFFGAAGLTVLVTVRQAAVAAAVRLSVVARTRVVLLPMTITGLDREFDIYPELAGGPDG